MKLETFFEKFDQFADAPGAVGKMRELVLELAIQGRLVEPKASDGDGHSLLKMLRTLPPERNSKSRSPKDIVVEPETPLEIPSHWALTTVENSTRDTGFFCDGDWVESKDQDPDGDVRLIQLADVGDGQYRDRSSRFMTKSAATRLNCSYLQAGDILVARMPDPLGRCCRFPGDSKPAVTVVDVCILRPNVTFFDPDFLVIAINGPRFRRLVSAQATGTTRSRISRSNLGLLPIPIPPLAEQKRIVAKVDELMALCDRLEAQQLEREAQAGQLARASLARFADAPTPANLNLLFHSSFPISPSDLRKSILTLAVQGKLVPQDPNDEPTEVIFSRVEAGQNQESVTPVDEAEVPWSLPSCWQWIRLGVIANIKHGYAFSSESFTSEPTPHVLTTPGNFYESGGFRDRGANTKYFNGDVPPDFIFNPRDLIIPMTEQAAGLLGSPAFIPDDGKTYLHNQRLGKLQIYSNEVAPEYLFWFFNSEFFRSELARTCTGMKVRHTSPKRILKVPFALPPLAEQRRIVTKVSELMALVDELETQLAASRAAAEKLLTALVAELTGTPSLLPADS
jgi:type I restriction enzyme S subunit